MPHAKPQGHISQEDQLRMDRESIGLIVKEVAERYGPMVIERSQDGTWRVGVPMVGNEDASLVEALRGLSLAILGAEHINGK